LEFWISDETRINELRVFSMILAPVCTAI
jgi:hypothetical protein